MINEEMNDNKSENKMPDQPEDNPSDIEKDYEELIPHGELKPNENSGIYFSSSLKISDPDTKEVLVQMRGDS